MALAHAEFQNQGLYRDALVLQIWSVDRTFCGIINSDSDWTLANTDANCFLSFGTLNTVSNAPSMQSLAGVTWQRAEFIHPPRDATDITEHAVVFAVHHNGMAYVVSVACADSAWPTVYPTWVSPILNSLQFTS